MKEAQHIARVARMIILESLAKYSRQIKKNVVKCSRRHTTVHKRGGEPRTAMHVNVRNVYGGRAGKGFLESKLIGGLVLVVEL